MWEQRTLENGEPQRTGNVGAHCSEPSVDTGLRAVSRTPRMGTKEDCKGCLASWEPDGQTAWPPEAGAEIVCLHFVLLALGLLENDADLRGPARRPRLQLPLHQERTAQMGQESCVAPEDWRLASAGSCLLPFPSLSQRRET